MYKKQTISIYAHYLAICFISLLTCLQSLGFGAVLRAMVHPQRSTPPVTNQTTATSRMTCYMPPTACKATTGCSVNEACLLVDPTHIFDVQEGPKADFDGCSWSHLRHRYGDTGRYEAILEIRAGARSCAVEEMDLCRCGA